MKTIYRILPLLVLLFVAQSCTDLDNNIYSEIVADDYEPTPLDELAKIGTAYTPLRSMSTRMRLGMEWDTDQMFCPVKSWGWSDLFQLFNHNYTSTSPEIDGGWSFAYSGINACNRTIHELENDEKADNESMIKELEALRSLYYYYLCDWYGNVAWATEYNTSKDYLPTQIARKDLADSIEVSLKNTLPFLHEDADKKTYGRFTKWAAFGTLAKLYLNWGVYAYGDGNNGRWEDCISMCDSIIESGHFALTRTQKEVFEAENDFSKEAIFTVVFDEDYAQGLCLFGINMNGQHVKTFNSIGMWPTGGGIMVPQFIDSYSKNDRRLLNNYIYGPQYDDSGNLMKAGLGSIAGQDFIIVNEVLSCEGIGGNCTENMGYRPAKYEYEIGLDGGNMNNDVFLIRYAEVLMMKAECLLRTGKADEAAKIVTEVRQRNFDSYTDAQVTASDLQQGSTYKYGYKECLQNRGKYPQNSDGTWKYTVSAAGDADAGGDDIVYGRFLDELGWEFDQEGRRRQDLIRFKTTSGKSVWIAKSWSSHKATNDPNKQLYPIPNREIQSNSNLNQNTGYN